MQLRDYQTKMIDDTRASISKGNRAVCLTAPTGAGKTLVASEIIRRSKAKGSEVLFWLRVGNWFTSFAQS